MGVVSASPPTAVPKAELIVCTRAGEVLVDSPLGSISDHIADRSALVWLDVQDPDAATIDLLGREFGFHPLALEDAAHGHQRPKVDRYGEYYFLVFYAAGKEPDRDRIRMQEIALFLGPNYLVTLHAGVIAEIAEGRRRWQASLRPERRDVGELLYSLLDSVVDEYFPLVDWISERIDDLENDIFAHYSREAIAELFAVKRDLLFMRRVVGPERNVTNVLLRHDTPIIDRSTHVYFQDLYDHIIRVADSIDTYRDLLSGAQDAYLSVTSNRLDRVMKTLTVFSSVLLVASLMTGFFGMNLAFPGKDDSAAMFWAVVALMVAAVGLVAMLFRRAGYW
jgi:magnesium transporter